VNFPLWKKLPLWTCGLSTNNSGRCIRRTRPNYITEIMKSCTCKHKRRKSKLNYKQLTKLQQKLFNINADVNEILTKHYRLEYKVMTSLISRTVRG